MDTAPTFDRHQQLRTRPDRSAWSAAGDEAVVLDLERSRYLALNDTASFLWQRLVVGASEDELVPLLRAEYDVSEDLARDEVHRFIADLWERGLVEEA